VVAGHAGAWGLFPVLLLVILASILSSVVTLRLGAPLLLVFLAIGMLLGGGTCWHPVR
jgi:NhaP-type Na+/H+ and K+/H+ antiporter